MNRRGFIKILAGIPMVGFLPVIGKTWPTHPRRLFDMMSVCGGFYRCEVIRCPDLGYQQARVETEHSDWIVHFHPIATLEQIRKYMISHLDNAVEQFKAIAEPA